MNKDQILKSVQENYDEKKPDEKEKLEVLMMARTFSMAFIIIIFITLFINFIFHNTTAIIENAAIAFTTFGIANIYLDKKQKKRGRVVLDCITIIAGFFFFVGYLGLLMGR